MRAHLPQARLDVVPKGGFVLWVKLPEGVDEVALTRACAERGVQVNPGRPWFPAEPEGAFLRLSYAAAGADAIRAGVAQLGLLMKAALSEARPRSR